MLHSTHSSHSLHRSFIEEIKEELSFKRIFGIGFNHEGNLSLYNKKTLSWILSRKKSIEKSTHGFVEPQRRILKFLTQFYTFKKFQRRLLSSYTIFFSFYPLYKISLEFHLKVFVNVHAFLLPLFFQRSARLLESSERVWAKEIICRSNLIVFKFSPVWDLLRFAFSLASYFFSFQPIAQKKNIKPKQKHQTDD